MEPSPAIAGLWKATLSRWGDLERHDHLLQSALAEGELAMVGRLYRIRLAHSPHDAYAARGRDEVLRLAAASSATLFKESSVDGSQGRWQWWTEPATRWKVVALLLTLLVCAMAFIQAFYLLLPGRS